MNINKASLLALLLTPSSSYFIRSADTFGEPGFSLSITKINKSLSNSSKKRVNFEQQIRTVE